MYCPKCKYTSFDHLEKCPKCGNKWNEIRKTLNLDWLPKRDLEDKTGSQALYHTEQNPQGEGLSPDSEHFHLQSGKDSQALRKTETRETDEKEFHLEEIDVLETKQSGEATSQEISHPDLEQLWDSYPTKGVQERNLNKATEQDPSAGDSHPESDAIPDLNLEEQENRKKIDKNWDFSPETYGEDYTQQKETPEQEEEIDITSLLDDFQDPSKKE